MQHQLLSLWHLCQIQIQDAEQQRDNATNVKNRVAVQAYEQGRIDTFTLLRDKIGLILETNKQS